MPTGTVRFADGEKVLGNVSLDSSYRAAFTTSSLAVGSHSIAAAYVPADPLLFSSSGTTLTQNVTPAAANITSSSTPNPSTFGQPVSFAVTSSETLNKCGRGARPDEMIDRLSRLRPATGTASGHHSFTHQCPLSGAKRTSSNDASTSASTQSGHSRVASGAIRRALCHS